MLGRHPAATYGYDWMNMQTGPASLEQLPPAPHTAEGQNRVVTTRQMLVDIKGQQGPSNSPEKSEHTS